MSTVGESLREAREAKGMTIAELAKKTHIMSKQLDGIERDDFSPIPAPIYVKSFIKTFATQVGLDPADMVALYLEQMKAGENPPAPTPELKVKKSKVRARKEQARAEKEAARQEAAEEAARQAEAAKAAKAAKKQARAAQKAEAAARRKADPAGLMPIVPTDEALAEEEAESTGLVEHQELLDFGEDSNLENELLEDELVEVDDREEDPEDLEDPEDDLEVEDIEIEAPAAASSVSVASSSSKTSARTRPTTSGSPAAARSASKPESKSKDASNTWQRPEPKPKRPARAPRPPRPPRPSISAVLAAKWKGFKAGFAKRFKRDESGFSMFGKSIAAATLRKALSMALLVCLLAALAFGAYLIADRMELRRAERGSSIGDLRTNPVITDPPDPYFITE